MDIPYNIHQYYNDIKLSTNVIYINNTSFITSISDNIHYGTVYTIDNLQCSTIEAQLKKVLEKYTIRGFRIKMIVVDIQFKSLKDRNACGALFDIISRDEYVLKIERQHRIAKKRLRCYFAMTSFNCAPRIVVVQLLFESMVNLRYYYQLQLQRILFFIIICILRLFSMNLHKSMKVQITQYFQELQILLLQAQL